MEPENTADYSKQEYWDMRYAQEAQYDWFATVYPACLERTLALLSSVAAAKASQQKQRDVIGGPPEAAPSAIAVSVLHLGIGNSNICFDLERSFEGYFAAAYPHLAPRFRPQLIQVAIDYSPVVIENMQKKCEDASSRIFFAAGDVSDLSNIRRIIGVDDSDRSNFGNINVKQQLSSALFAAMSPSDAELPPRADAEAPHLQQQQQQLAEEAAKKRSRLLFDVVMDKGTMDALQADKESDSMDSDIELMLREASDVTRFCFVQVTWEVPYYRLHYTRRPEFVWGWDAADTDMSKDATTPPPPIEHFLLGESDMYRFYIYRTQAAAMANVVALPPSQEALAAIHSISAVS